MSVNTKMTAIADAIRGKTGGTSPLTLDQMAAQIASMASGGQYETGEIIGDGVIHNGIPVQIPLSFEPDVLVICLTDTTTPLDANHVFGGVIIRDIFYQAANRAANGANALNGGFGFNIDGLTGPATNKATYADGVVSWYLAPSSKAFYNGASYTWIAGKW